MLIVTGSKLTIEEAENFELTCDAVDYASILIAETNDESEFDGCSQLPRYSIALKLAEDMVIPSFLCPIHFMALKMSLQDGTVGVDEDFFGELPNKD
jgi:hypothetical protein